jgi:hypothetical protein
VDFLHKPLDTLAVKSKVSVFVDLYRQRKVLDRQVQALERSRRSRSCCWPVAGGARRAGACGAHA